MYRVQKIPVQRKTRLIDNFLDQMFVTPMENSISYKNWLQHTNTAARSNLSVSDDPFNGII